MESIEDANERNRRHWEERDKPRRNGIACPTCGHEMEDKPGMLLTDPPKLRVKCTSCGYEGTRIAP